MTTGLVEKHRCRFAYDEIPGLSWTQTSPYLVNLKRIYSSGLSHCWKNFSLKSLS